MASQNSSSLRYKYSIIGLTLKNTSAHLKEGVWVTPFDFRINLEKNANETFNKGVISGSFGLQLSLTSTFIPPAQDGNNATLEARLSVDTAPYPLTSKGCSISGISPGFKIMPATK